MLADGALDVALVSSFEYLRNPIYTIVDDVSISSDGPVYSVIVAHEGDISAIEEIALDPASATSVNLLRCLVVEKKLKARLSASSAEKKNHARLLIGDQAIRFRQQHPDCPIWDLGEEWKKQTGLPFVFALWLIRPGVSSAGEIAAGLRACRDTNMKRLASLADAQPDFTPDFCKRYFQENLRYKFGAQEKEGLLHFSSVCQQHGILSSADAPLSLT